jgi:photosystem II stability/assembly factor-like uncharacterized protein
MNIQIFSAVLAIFVFASCQQDTKTTEINSFRAVAASLKGTEKAETPASNLFYPELITGPGCRKVPKKTAAAANIIFRSSDGGQTWQDVSAGLPQDVQLNCVFASGNNIFLGSEDGLIRSSSTATAAPVWQKDFFLDNEVWGLFAGKTGPIAFTHGNRFLQQMTGGLWQPMFADLRDKLIRTMLETPDGTLFVGCDNGILKSSDHGKTWKQVFDDGIILNMVESNGVILGGGQKGILRSTDGGEHWDWALSEGGVGISTERIEGGFAVITYNTESETRRVRISTDGGKNWKAIDAGLSPSSSIASIKQVGEYFFCGHPEGIFRSADQGKTWKLVFPSIGKKVFNLSVLGKVIYAVPRNSGC